jgi:two-component system response regulator AtoC
MAQEKERILVVDDERLVRWTLLKKFTEWGFEVTEASSAGEALEQYRRETPDVLVLDVRLPDMTGIELLRQIKSQCDSCAVIMITANPQVDDVKAALKIGAFDFIAKPFDFDELRVTVQNALETRRLRAEVDTLRDEVKRKSGYHDVVASSRKMVELMEFVRKVANSEASTILIQGESGTGKDLIAKFIHYNSARQNRPFLPINCSAIPETLMEAELFGHERGAFTDAKAMKRGLCEMADGGTLLLDEIGEMSLVLQAKLLRVLEDQTFRRIGGVKDMSVNIRVIAASNRDLEQAVREGRFREDLFYRLTIIPVFIPPLRQHRDDIPHLVSFFIEHYNQKFKKSIRGLSPEAAEIILKYDWPGNVRELKNAIERAMILEDDTLIRPIYLPFQVTSQSAIPSSMDAFPDAKVSESRWTELPSGRLLPVLEIPARGTSLEEVERELVHLALKQTAGNQTHAAHLLDISRDALRYKMKKFGLEKIS